MHIFQVQGMHCASCAHTITKKISKLPHVQNAEVNYATEKARIEFDESKTNIDTFNEELQKLGYALVDETPLSRGKLAHNSIPSERAPQDELASLEEKTHFILPVTITVFALMLWDIAAKYFVWIPNIPIPMPLLNIFLMILATVTLFLIGEQYIRGVVRFIRFRVANMDTLIGIGTLTAYPYSAIITIFPLICALLRSPEYTFFDITIFVIGFITLGKYLEAKSKRKTGEAIQKLLELQAKTAFVVQGDTEVEVAIEAIVRGNIIRVKPGANIPVDGIITNGDSFIDESMITGEPMPIRKTIGDTVISGTINTTGSFMFRAEKVGSETLLAHIIKMVEEAQGSRAPIQALADKISAVFVPVVIVIAFATLGMWITVGSSYLGFSEALSLGIFSFVSVLVIACPCALGLATPTAIIVGVGKGAREGILIKDAATLEKLHAIDTVVVDKTGTITKGRPTLTDIRDVSDLGHDTIVSILASLETASEHPIARAITNYAREKNISFSGSSKFESIRGKGIRGSIGGVEYFAGSESYIRDLGLSFDATKMRELASQGKTPILLATAKHVLGLVAVADEIRPESKRAVSDLRALGINVILLTGDDDNVARHIASLAGIDTVIAHALPEDKLKKIQSLQSEGRKVAMAGDGVNDAPALAKADVGIAMGTGTDVAIETAGITLLHGDISKLVQAIRLSKFTMRGIKQNLFWAFAYNIVGIPIAGGALFPFFGWLLNPVFAGLAMAFSSVSVVGNSLRLKAKKI